jgi:putative heme iron utilization protein
MATSKKLQNGLNKQISAAAEQSLPGFVDAEGLALRKIYKQKQASKKKHFTQEQLDEIRKIGCDLISSVNGKVPVSK